MATSRRSSMEGEGYHIKETLEMEISMAKEQSNMKTAILMRVSLLRIRSKGSGSTPT
jgi:hypothetical protein